MKFSTLRLEDFSLRVHLGCTAEERAIAQEVRVSIEFRFFEPPPAVKTDRLEDTICYAEVSQSLESVCRGKEFHLVERLAAEMLAALREVTATRAEVAVCVHKVRPPIHNLIGGTYFKCGDFAL
jgi:7,8-dihydroneopterin aldolase/epimerase/oxygenase